MLKAKIFIPILLIIVFVLSSIVVIVSLQNRQIVQQQAQKATVLAIEPTAPANQPQQHTIGDTITTAIVMNPGTNFITTVHLTITYDATKLSILNDEEISINTDAFPTMLEPLSFSPGKIIVAVSVGSDPTKAITAKTTVGTITFSAIQATEDTPTVVHFGTDTTVLSAGPNDQYAENVLSSTIPTYIAIAAPITDSDLSVDAFLHGIGNSGDNANPTAFSLSNKNPLHKERMLTIELLNANEKVTGTISGTMTYASSSGNFKGSFNIPASTPAGIYTLRLRTKNYLKKNAPGFITFTPGTSLPLTTISFVAGDTNDDNSLNILDYNRIRDCYSDLKPPISCETQERKENTDANDDGRTNQYDYNLFLREISVQYGD